MSATIIKETCPLTYIEVSKELDSKIPKEMKHKTECDGDYMMLGNYDECDILGLDRDWYDFFIVKVVK